MYDIMRDIGGSDEVSGFVDDLVGLGAPVQGVHIGADEAYAGWYYTRFAWPLWPHYSDHDPTWSHPKEERLQRPDWWDQYTLQSGQHEGASPFFVRIVLNEEAELPVGLPTRQLPNTAGALRVVYEIRPPAEVRSTRLLGNGHAVRSIGGKFGTCGGALQDSGSGTKYGMTCLHVLSKPGDVVDHGSSARLGGRTSHDSLVRTPPSGFCNRLTVATGTEDWAIFEVDPGVTVQAHHTRHGRVHTERRLSTMGPYLPVEFNGATSGLRVCETGSIGIWHEVLIDGIAHCFGDIIQLRWQPGTLTGRRSNRDLVQSGDSGAWVVGKPAGNAPGAEWFGMTVAGDGADGYAALAEDLLTQARKASGMSLTFPL